MPATLDRDSLRRTCPSVFASSPWEGMSPSYRFIPTAEVLGLMADQGFRVTSARQSRTRIPGKADFTRHMLRLHHADHAATVGEVPEIVLLNSHDRSSAYKLYTGIFRAVCENGLIVQSADFGGFSIRHSGTRDLFAQVREATARIMDGIPAIMGRIDRWREVVLPRPRQLELAAAAMELKPNPSISPAQLLTSRRPEDDTDGDGNRDLWRTFNVIEESLLKGGLQGRNARGRRISTRPIKAVDADLRIHRQLWQLAEGFSLN